MICEIQKGRTVLWRLDMPDLRHHLYVMDAVHL